MLDARGWIFNARNHGSVRKIFENFQIIVIIMITISTKIESRFNENREDLRDVIEFTWKVENSPLSFSLSFAAFSR